MAFNPKSYAFSNVSGVVKSFVLPETQIDPQGDWEQNWGVFCPHGPLSNRVPGLKGNLRIRRQMGSGDKVLLTIDYWKQASGDFVNRTQAEVECRVDSLCTPLSWAMRCFTEDKSGKVIENELSSKGICKKYDIHLKDSTGRRTKVVSGDRTALWALFDAVQRLPGGEFDPLMFTFLDDLDHPLPGHSLSFRKTEEFHLKAEGKSESEKIAKRVFIYDHLGTGIVPMTYYVAEDGRLLFVLTGMDTFVLQSGKGAQS